MGEIILCRRSIPVDGGGGRKNFNIVATPGDVKRRNINRDWMLKRLAQEIVADDRHARG